VTQRTIFGDASATNLAADLTGEGRIVGTVAYMSPEQAEGKPLDHRSDIFSLGVLLYELATGERPFSGDTNMSTLSAILKDTPRSVTDVRPDVPRDLARIIKRALVKDPEHRCQTAKDLRNRALARDGDLGCRVDHAGAVASPTHARRGEARLALRVRGRPRPYNGCAPISTHFGTGPSTVQRTFTSKPPGSPERSPWTRRMSPRESQVAAST
jgi:serine/threonine protein kinase